MMMLAQVAAIVAACAACYWLGRENERQHRDRISYRRAIATRRVLIGDTPYVQFCVVPHCWRYAPFEYVDGEAKIGLCDVHYDDMVLCHEPHVSPDFAESRYVRLLRRVGMPVAALLLMSILTPTPANATPTVAMAINCHNHDRVTGLLEPVQTWWPAADQFNDPPPRVIIQIESPPGNPIGRMEPASLPPEGYHDNWIGRPIPNGIIRATVYLDGIAVAAAEEDCTRPTATVHGTEDVRWVLEEPPEPARSVTVTEPAPGPDPALECIVARIGRDERDRPVLAGIDDPVAGPDRVRVAVVGGFLWVDAAGDGLFWGFTEDNPHLTSIAIGPDATSVEVCR